MLPQIEAVSGERDVLDVLSALVEQSLVRQSEVEGEPRFRMLVTIREYARVRLAESGETDEISRRHAAAFLALAEEGEAALWRRRPKRWLDVVELEQRQSARGPGMEHLAGDAEAASRLVFALWRFWQRRGYLTEGANWCDRVLALPAENVPPLVQVRALEATAGSHIGARSSTSGRTSTRRRWRSPNASATRARRRTRNTTRIRDRLNLKNVPRALELLRGAREKWIHLGDRAAVGRASWALDLSCR